MYWVNSTVKMRFGGSKPDGLAPRSLVQNWLYRNDLPK